MNYFNYIRRPETRNGYTPVKFRNITI
ncbi:hypothetical protein [Companilactobacillus muriivasis]